MDDDLIYVKTNIGEEMVAERTRLVQRNLRVVLIMVDGLATVADLKRQAGDSAMVNASLDELERLGLIETVNAKQKRAKRREAAASASSRFTFENKTPTELKEPQEPNPSTPSATPATSERNLSGWQALEGTSTVARGMPDYFDDSPSRPSTQKGRPTRADETPLRRSRTLIEVIREKMAARRKRKQAEKDERAFHLAYERATEADTIEPVKLKRIRRGPRRVIAWPLGLIMVIAGAAFVLVLTAVLFPYQRYVPEMEQLLGAALQDRVKVGNVHFSFLPYPNVTLEGVAIGAQPYATAQVVRVIPDLSWLFGAQRILRDVRIDGLRLRSQGIAPAAHWFDAMAPNKSGVIVHGVRIDDLVIELGDTALVGLAGNVLMTPAGGLDKVVLQNADHTLRLEAEPAAAGYKLVIIGAEWKSPFRPHFLFSYLDARGELTSSRLNLNNIQGRLYEGSIEGTAVFDWSRGIGLVANIAVKRASSSKLFAALNPALSVEGDISGKLQLESRAEGFSDVLNALRVDGDFSVARGVINRFDLVDAVRGGNRGQTRGGSTRFERMSGSLRFDEHAYRVTNLRISSGLMHANGGFDVDRNQALGGLMDVSLRGSAGVFRTQVHIGGTLSDPQLSTLQPAGKSTVKMPVLAGIPAIERDVR